MKVNMTPNPLDVVTIHASQGDTEARQWEFELHNNGELIDTSDVKEQMFFKSYKGGTEQLLPENTSTPTTSPFKGDIKYPQGLLSDQEFLYRESPTEEDGLAKITDIKGNTLVWNQLVQNGNFVDSSNWYARQSTYTVSDNIATVTPSTEGTERGMYCLAFPIKANHKYLLSCEIKPPIQSTARVSFGGAINYGFDVVIQANQWNKCQGIVLNDTDRNIGFYSLIRESLTPSQTIQFRNMMVIDLTQMGLDISSPSDFTSLFSLPYYAYNQGTLLSFNGNGIKTVGKNLFDFSQFANGTITFENGVLTGTTGQFYTAYRDVVNNGIELKYPKNTQITISFDARTEQNDSPTGGGLYFTASENGIRVQLATTTNDTAAIQHITVTIPSNRHIDKLGWTYGSNPSNIWHITNFQVEFGATETSYEPYTSSTLSLPISTYFPTGMKDVPSAYDELTPNKAITRIGMVDLGTLDYTKTTYAGAQMFYTSFSSAVHTSDIITGLCSKYEVSNDIWSAETLRDKLLGLNYLGTTLFIYDSSFTDLTPLEFKTAIQGVYLYYELATPTETPITTASLVTENAEIPLSNEDGVLIGKCTEQLSSESGFFDAKIKLADEDGECYSNKIQLHVERSPQ